MFSISLFEFSRSLIAHFGLFLRRMHSHFCAIFLPSLQILVVSFAETFILLWKHIFLNKTHTEANTELFVIKGKQKTSYSAQNHISFCTKYAKPIAT
jgi:hypothetical protein